jgi:hypothetical protein
MKELPLKNGGTTIVSDEDYERLSAFTWTKTNRGYASRGSGSKVMHKYILSPKDGFEVDHINRDKLDNRRENLRYVTHKENMQNYTPVAWTKTSKYRGVFKESASGQYRVNIRIDNNKKLYVGRFKDEIDAALAFDINNIELKGKKARCNFLIP